MTPLLSCGIVVVEFGDFRVAWETRLARLDFDVTRENLGRGLTILDRLDYHHALTSFSELEKKC